MPQFLADILSQMKAIWMRLDGGQRLTISVVLLATLVGIGAIVWYSSQPSLQVIASGNNYDLAEVTKALEDERIPYTQSGTQILVDRGLFGKAAAALSARNVQSSSGSDKSFLESMTSSAEDRAAMRLRQLQQQAEHALRGIHGVRDARVQASKPRRSAFRMNDKGNQPRATVLLRLTPGVSFQRVARSAAETVASTIGLPPEDVIVIDMVTQATFKLNPDGPNTDVVGFRRQERELEAVYQEKALQVLGPLGDKVRVTITVHLDPEYTSTRRKYIAPEPVIVQERTTKENRQGAGKTQGGDPSVTNAVAGNESKARTTSTGESTKKQTTDRTYDADLGTVVEGLMAPKIKRLSLGLTIDEELRQKADDIKKVVMAAIGWDETRDGPADRIQPYVTKFPPPEPLPEQEGPGLLSSATEYLPVVGQVLGVLLVILFLRSVLKRSTVAPLPSVPADEPDLIDLDDEAMTTDETAKRMRREIEKSITEDPSTMSHMLENWLAEQKG